MTPEQLIKYEKYIKEFSYCGRLTIDGFLCGQRNETGWPICVCEECAEIDISTDFPDEKKEGDKMNIFDSELYKKWQQERNKCPLCTSTASCQEHMTKLDNVIKNYDAEEFFNNSNE